jgi:hypothetical protein
MKNKIIYTILFIAVCFPAFNANAQDVSNYFLAPTGLVLPVGEKTDIKIRREDHIFSDKFYEGSAAFLTGLLPVWSIVSKPNAGANKDEGSITSPLNRMAAVYTAPDKIPAINPVTVAVKFKANDTSKQEVTLLCTIKIVDPGQNWFFAYTCSRQSTETIKSAARNFTKQIKAVGSASMLVEATPPEKNGYVLINTEQSDQIINPRINGFYNYHEDDIEKAPNGNLQARTLRNSAGTPGHGQTLLFEYDPSLKGYKGGLEGAGISFEGTGTIEFWRQGSDTKQLKKTRSKVDQNYLDGISLGSRADNIKKIKHGFSIDFSQSKDTSYVEGGEKHTIKSKKQYHAVLLWMNKE